MAKAQAAVPSSSTWSRSKFKKTSQGCGHIKMSSMNKHKKRGFKKYRGQGK